MILAFSNFELDMEGQQLRQNGGAVPLQPLLFDLLAYLVENRERVVSKQELAQHVWKGAFVGDGAITQAIFLLRRALNDTNGSALVQTVRKRGYRFDASVRSVSPGRNGGPVPPDVRTKTPFVGRRRVMGLLQHALDSTSDGQSRIVLLSGEPGIGKTRTCSEFAELAEKLGACVFQGNALEGEGAPNYRPWAQLIRAALQTNCSVADLSDATKELFADAILGLNDVLGMDERKRSESNESDRTAFELFDRVAHFWSSLAKKIPLVLVINDLHRADLPSLRMLDFVVEETRSERILFVLTFREAEVRRDQQRARSLGALARRDNANSETLARFTRAEVAELFRGMSGREGEEPWIVSLHKESGGNPFLLKELVWLWLQEPEESPIREPTATVPGSMIAVIERHLDIVSSDCREVLTTASVLGRELDLHVLAALLQRGLGAVAENLDEALRAEILTQLDSYRMQFTHALIQEALYDTLPPERRIDLHARAGTAIEELYGRNNNHVEQLAHHFHVCAGAGYARQAFTYRRRAGLLAVKSLAFEEAVEHYAKAIEVAPWGGADETEVVALLVRLAEAAFNAGDYERARNTSQEAMERARLGDEVLSFARAVHTFSLSNETDLAKPAIIQALEEAVERYRDESPLRVRLLTRLANAHWFSEPPTRARDLVLQAVEVGRRVGDPDSLALALTWAHRICHGFVEDRTKCIAFSADLIGLLPQVRGAAARLECRWHLLWDPLERGDRVAYDQQIDGMLREAEETRHPFARWNAAIFRISRLHLTGQFSEAEAEAEQARDLPSPGGRPFREQLFAQQMLGLRFDQGRYEDYLDTFRAQVTGEKPVAWQAFLFLGEVKAGQKDEACAWISSITQDDLGKVRRDTTWFMTLSYLAELCYAVDAKESASVLYRNLLPFEQHHTLIPAAWFYRGSVARHLGGLAFLLERWEEAERHLKLAIERDWRMGAPVFVALGQYDYARLLCRRDGYNASATAKQLLEEVTSTAHKLDLRRLGREAEHLTGR